MPAERPVRAWREAVVRRDKAGEAVRQAEGVQIGIYGCAAVRVDVMPPAEGDCLAQQLGNAVVGTDQLAAVVLLMALVEGAELRCPGRILLLKVVQRLGDGLLHPEKNLLLGRVQTAVSQSATHGADHMGVGVEQSAVKIPDQGGKQHDSSLLFSLVFRQSRICFIMTQTNRFRKPVRYSAQES